MDDAGRFQHILQSLQREWRILAGFLLAAVLCWTFIEVAEEMREGSTLAIDRAILLWFRDPADLSRLVGPPFFQEMMRDFTAVGGTGVLTLVTLAVAGFFWLDGKRREAALLLSAVIGGLLLSTALKAGFQRPRPDVVPHFSIVSSPSFPSGHSMLSAVAYLTIGALIARLRTRRRMKAFTIGFAAFITILVGISRVYLGVHWPTDVLAGWTMGAAWALVCWLVALVLQTRGDLPAEPPPAGSEQ